MDFIKQEARKQVLFIAIPMIIQGFVFQIQSITDKIFLGNLNSTYLSVIGATDFPFGTTLSLMFALSVGIIIIVSQLYGNNKKKSIVTLAKSGNFYFTILSWGLFILWFFFSRQLFTIMSVDSYIMDYCVSYVRITSIYLLIAGCDMAMQGMLQGLGKTKPIMYAGIIKVGVNIFLDWVLIFGKFGVKPMGLEGAAIATLSANIISVSITILLAIRELRILNGKKLKLLFSVKIHSFIQIVKIGVPASVENFLWNGSNLVLLSFLNSMSYVATAIYTLTFSVELILYEINNSLGNAGLTVSGIYIGKNEQKSAKNVIEMCLLYSLIVVGVSILIICFFAEPIIGLFTHDRSIIHKTAPFLIFTAFILIPKSFNMIIGSGIRAYGDTKWMLVTQIIGSIFVITFSFILIKVLKVGVVGIYITLLMDEIIRAVINSIHYFKGKLVNLVDISTL